MLLHDWALIIFTTLGQLSVGAFTILGITTFIVAQQKGTEAAEAVANRALWLIGGSLVLGFVASFFHLGKPLKAYRAILGLPTSWLSWEIVVGIIFAALGFLFTILQWKQVGNSMSRRILGAVTALVGLFLVYTMYRVYALPAQLSWNHWTTLGQFYATTLLLGTVALAANYMLAYQWTVKQEPEVTANDAGSAGVDSQLVVQVIRGLAFGAILALGIEFIIVVLNVIHVEGVSSSAMFTGSTLALLIVRLILAFIGAGVLGLFIVQLAKGGQVKKLATSTYLAAILVLIAEVIGRYLFYSTQVLAGLAP